MNFTDAFEKLNPKQEAPGPIIDNNISKSDLDALKAAFDEQLHASIDGIKKHFEELLKKENIEPLQDSDVNIITPDATNNNDDVN